MNIKKIAFAVTFLFVCTNNLIAYADSVAYSTVTQSINSGSLMITGPESLSLPGVQVQGAEQYIQGVLSGVNVNDSRGTGVGWSSSITMENLTLTKDPIAGTGNNGPLVTLNETSHYDGTCGVTSGAIYTVTINTAGQVGTATYSVTGGCSDSNQSNITTASVDNNVGSRGVKIDFPTGNYSSGDNWIIVTDVYPFTDLEVTPQNPSAALEGSDLTGVTASTAGNLTGSGTVSSPKVLLTAENGKGLGSYNQDVNLELKIHARPLSGYYSGTIILNVS